MAIGERLTSFLKVSNWRKSKRATKKSRPKSITDVTDVIRNIDGMESSYCSFDVDFQYEVPAKLRESPKKSRKSENRKSWMSFMCGTPDHFDFKNSQENIVKPEKRPHKAKKSENRRSWMSLMCGSDNLDFENYFEILPNLEETPKKCDKSENRKSWMSFVCGLENDENEIPKSAYRDSGISLLSDDFVVSKMPTHTKYQSKSCDNILESLRHCETNCSISLDESLDNNSMNNLFRTTSIQENSLRLMRKRHRNVKRKRGADCDSCYSSCDFQILAGSKSENDITSMDSIVEREVRFAEMQHDSKEKSVSSMEVGRTNSLQLKSWQIRRQRRDQKNKQKRESRNLELLLSKDFEFQERLIE